MRRDRRQKAGPQSEPRAEARGQVAKRPRLFTTWTDAARGRGPGRALLLPALTSAGVRVSAFTLIELMVSVAVLLGLMAMIAMIFSSAGKASGQAQSSTALYRVVGQIALTLQQDLENMQPGDSILGIARVNVPAYETLEAAQSGSGVISTHRADVLMLVTQRQFEPYIFPPVVPGDTFEEYRHVIYGHANIGRINAAGTGWATKTNIEPAAGALPLPASKWHLARRITGGPTLATLGLAGFGSRLHLGGWPLAGDLSTGAARYTGDTGDPNDPVNAANFENYTDLYYNGGASILDLFDAIAPGMARYDNTGALSFYYAQNGNDIYRSEGGALYCLAPQNNRLYWW